MEKKTSGQRRLWLLAALIPAAVLLLFLIIIGCLIASAPDIDTISVSPAESATYICSADGTPVRRLTLAGSNRDIVTLDEIPDDLANAVIAIEDERFYHHGGIDVRGILRAALTGITSGSFSEGASTITQQLIKNNVFTEWTLENSFFDRFTRKVQEQYLALQLENRISKEEILEDYLNTINLGAGCYGVQAASRRYFGKDVSKLTLSEAAVLAAIPQNPTGYNPILYPKDNRRRAEIILGYMAEQGLITADQQAAALADDVYTRIRTFDESYEEESAYSYYEDALIDQVLDLLVSEKGYSSEQAYRAVYSGGLRIFSAQDSAIQQICDEEFQNPANFPDGTLYGVDYALSVADENGLVTHYGTEALRTFIRQTENASFDLMCSSAEEAQRYAALFREDVLGTSIMDAGDDAAPPIMDSGGGTAPPSLTVVGERLTLSPQPQASLILLDQHTGCVRAVIGGRGEKTASLTLNRATDTTRQPGSTFKILTAYAPAIDAFGQTLATLYENEPYHYKDGVPVSNWDINDYSGITTIREAITRSINVVAVKCITSITPRAGFDYARKFGITTLHESYESENGISSDIIQPLALGGITQGVTNLELCSAYAAIADRGLYRRPKFFTKILDRRGEVILDYTPENQAQSQAVRVLDESTSFLLTDAMRDVVSSPSGTAYGTIYAANQPVAGKTGTTSNYKDIWFVGYTPYYTCCVWGGYDNNQNLPDGSTYHTYSKLLWSSVMNRIHQELPPADFTMPENVLPVTLCSESHLPAVPGGCPHTYTEYFVTESVPDQECPLHEPAPETEPIFIYPDIVDQLTPEAEQETPGEAESETQAETPPGAESETQAETLPGAESETQAETLPGAESETQAEIPHGMESGTQPDTSSFDDLLNRLAEETWTFGF